jgi:polyhydroxyalkanoate synthase
VSALSTIKNSVYQRLYTPSVQNLISLILRAHTLNQAGKTPFEVIAQQDIVKLRFYPPESAQCSHLQPVVIVPPLATNMLIYDLFPDRSLVKFLRDQGHPVYLIDWGSPTRQHAHFTFETYLKELMPIMLANVRTHSKQQTLSLHGWSLGAMLCYSYTALGDSDINKLVLIGPPCDYHSGKATVQNRLLAKQVLRIEKLTRRQIHSTRQHLWHVPGWFNALGFKLMSPGGTIRGNIELIKKLNDRDYVAAHATNAAFLNQMVAYPGGVAQDIIRYLITDNVLAKGQLPIKNCTANLSAISAKVLIIIGDKDPIITPSASKKMIALMPLADCQQVIVPGGHMSIVSGSNAPQLIWPKVAEFLAS